MVLPISSNSDYLLALHKGIDIYGLLDKVVNGLPNSDYLLVFGYYQYHQMHIFNIFMVLSISSNSDYLLVFGY